MSLITLHRYLERQDQLAERSDAAWEWAKERVLSDMTVFTEWLADQCGFADRIVLGYVPRDGVALADMVAAATVPQLVALTLYPRTETVAAAAHELRQRYVQAETTREYISKVADQYEPEDA